MRRCVTCEGYLQESAFEKDGPVCKACVARLQRVYHVDYAPPEKKTVREAYVSLVLAIRDQAEKDQLMDDWEEYWIQSEKWRRVWALIQMTKDQSVDATHNMYSRIGGLM